MVRKPPAIRARNLPGVAFRRSPRDHHLLPRIATGETMERTSASAPCLEAGVAPWYPPGNGRRAARTMRRPRNGRQTCGGNGPRLPDAPAPPQRSMKPTNTHRCGKHVVNANPASPIPIWTDCAVHSERTRVADRFRRISLLEFTGEEALRLGWIVEHAMLE